MPYWGTIPCIIVIVHAYTNPFCARGCIAQTPLAATRRDVALLGRATPIMVSFVVTSNKIFVCRSWFARACGIGWTQFFVRHSGLNSGRFCFAPSNLESDFTCSASHGFRRGTINDMVESFGRLDPLAVVMCSLSQVICTW